MRWLTERSTKGTKKRFAKAASLCLTTLLALTFIGCGSSAMDMATNSAVKSESMAVSGGSTGGGKFEVEYGAVMEEALMDGGSAEAPGANATEQQNVLSDRKLIKTVDMNVETRNFDELLDTIETQVIQLGGYIENMETYNGSSYSSYRSTRDANMTLRIPKENLDTFLNTVSDISNVVRRSDSVEDVTLAYVDLESHRDALRTEQDRLLELLKKAETVEDIITIEQRLSDVRYQLESMESQLRTYDNQVDYSTVYLNVDEVEIFTPVEEETVWERISGGFMESLDNVGEGFVEFGIWFVVNIPYFVVWVVLLAAFICLLVWLIKHATKPPKSKTTNNFTAQQIVNQITEQKEQE